MNMNNANNNNNSKQPQNVGGLKLLHSVIFAPSYSLKITEPHNYPQRDVKQIKYVPLPPPKKSPAVFFKEMIYSVQPAAT